MVAGRRVDPVDEDPLAGGIDDVAAREVEAGDAILAADAIDVGGVVEIDELVGREARIHRHPEKTTLGLRADGGDRNGEGRRPQQAPALLDPQRSALGRDEQAAVGREGQRRRPPDARDEGVGEVRGKVLGGHRRGQGGSGNENRPHRQQSRPQPHRDLRDSSMVNRSGVARLRHIRR